MFSILIPTWNNLPYLKLCIDSIQKHSAFHHDIVVHVNEGIDGTLAYLQEKNIPYTHSTKNVGICTALNQAYSLAKHDYIVYMNDDMYCLPNWDTFLLEEIKNLNHHLYMLSATMIEPVATGNSAVIAKNYGSGVNDFDEKKLLQEYDTFTHQDWSGSCWPPSLVHRSMWERIGGYSELFSPGMSSDDDFAMRMWLAGCRYFKGVASSRVYHFQCKSTGRIVKNNGRNTFLHLYGITQSTFTKYYLRRGKPFSGSLTKPTLSISYLFAICKSKLKRLTQIMQ